MCGARVAIALLLCTNFLTFADGDAAPVARPVSAVSLTDGGASAGGPRDGVSPGGFDQLKGDSNCDGVVNFRDINAFVTALSAGPVGWSTATGCAISSYTCLNDINGDGVVSFADINPFVAILVG
jgi:hypothetical protein